MNSDLQHYQIHTLESAPEESRRALHALNSELGFIPNVAAIMAESPDLLNGFVGVLFAAGLVKRVGRKVNDAHNLWRAQINEFTACI